MLILIGLSNPNWKELKKDINRENVKKGIKNLFLVSLLAIGTIFVSCVVFIFFG